MADNTWSCECGFVETFHNWLVKHSQDVLDSQGVACVIDGDQTAAMASALVTTSDFEDEDSEDSKHHLR